MVFLVNSADILWRFYFSFKRKSDYRFTIIAWKSVPYYIFFSEISKWSPKNIHVCVESIGNHEFSPARNRNYSYVITAYELCFLRIVSRFVISPKIVRNAFYYKIIYGYKLYQDLFAVLVRSQFCGSGGLSWRWIGTNTSFALMILQGFWMFRFAAMESLIPYTWQNSPNR